MLCAHLLVMPISRMLFSASTPSILVSSWLTTVSWTPLPLETLPRCLQMASISSKMMTCSSDASPFCACSASASCGHECGMALQSWHIIYSEI